MLVTVLDTNALLIEACALAKSGDRQDKVTALATTRRATPYIAAHVPDEIDEHLAKVAADLQVPERQARRVLDQEILPHLRVVDLEIRDHLSPEDPALARFGFAVIEWIPVVPLVRVIPAPAGWSVCPRRGAEVGEGAEAGRLQVLDDLVMAGGLRVVVPAWPGGGDPDELALLVGQGEEVQAVAVVLAGEVGRSFPPGAVLGRIRVPSINPTSPPRRAIWRSARSRPGAFRRAGRRLIAPAPQHQLAHAVAAGQVEPGARRPAASPPRAPAVRPAGSDRNREQIAFRRDRSRSRR